MVGQVLYTKRAVKTVALVIFTIQMIFALQKYISNPSMSLLGTKTLSSMDKSMMISVCKSSQFNYSRAQVLGYNWASDFLAGTTKNSTILSWTGIKKNSTFNETFNHLYNPGLGKSLTSSFLVDSTLRPLGPYSRLIGQKNFFVLK